MVTLCQISNKPSTVLALGFSQKKNLSIFQKRMTTTRETVRKLRIQLDELDKEDRMIQHLTSKLQELNTIGTTTVLLHQGRIAFALHDDVLHCGTCEYLKNIGIESRNKFVLCKNVSENEFVDMIVEIVSEIKNTSP
jgi:hypothetical protein